MSLVIYVLFFSSFLAVTSVVINGTRNVSQDSILEQINPEISGQIWKSINKNNLLLVKKSNIQKNILEKFRLIRSVKVQRKFPNKLEIVVTERTPTMLFQGANGCFILDENAAAYDSANPTAEEVVRYNLPQLNDADGKNINLGDVVLDSDYVTYIAKVREKIQNDAEVPIENTFQTPSLISKDIRAKTQEGWEIYFNESLSVDKEIEMLNAVLAKTIDKNQRLDLEYIDLRIDNKVYYKFRDGTPEEAARLAASAAEQAVKDAATAPASPSDNKDEKKKK